MTTVVGIKAPKHLSTTGKKIANMQEKMHGLDKDYAENCMLNNIIRLK